MTIEKKHCIRDIDNKNIIANTKIFEELHQKKGIKLLNWDKYIDDLIVIPVTINICLDSKKLKINFIKYAKNIIDILNDGFSGKIYSKYKNVNTNIIKDILLSSLDKNLLCNIEHYTNLIYNYINNNTDTNIKFYLQSIVFHDIFLEEEFQNNDTEKFITTLNYNGFRLKEYTKKNLNINIMAFKCSTLGVSIFPWMKYITKSLKEYGYMQVYLDYCTIDPEIANNNFNQCRTLIHEVGHVLGLRHTFNATIDTLQVYSIILGKIIVEREILNKINNDNFLNIKYNFLDNNDKIANDIIDKNDILHVKNNLIHNKDNVQLYPDIPIQHKPTNFNPFESQKFPFFGNIPTNFSCFMDYSPDSVLTHFTYSQSRIMHYMIRIFKPYIINNTENEQKYLNNCDVKVYINYKNYLSPKAKKEDYYYKIKYDSNINFKYIIEDPNNDLDNYIYLK